MDSHARQTAFHTTALHYVLQNLPLIQAHAGDTLALLQAHPTQKGSAPAAAVEQALYGCGTWALYGV